MTRSCGGSLTNRPTVLEVLVRRYRCADCAHVWRQDTAKAAEPKARLSHRGLRSALEGIVVQHLTVARIAEGLDVSWNTANDAVLAEGRRVLINDPARFDGVTTIGVDEHVWRHTHRGDKCRRRIQQDLHGHRGRAGDPLYSARRTLHTGTSLLTDKHKTRLEQLFADDHHAAVEATWAAYQQMITAYREPDPARGRDLMNKLIASLASGVPAALVELRSLGRTLKLRDLQPHLPWLRSR